MTLAADVIVIGTGAAGLMAALAASQTCHTLLVTDRAVGHSNTAMAQGGVQLPLPTAESRLSFVADILASARVPLDRDRVVSFVDHVVPAIRALQQWGLALDREDDGQLVRRLAGGLSEARIVSVRDQIGPAIMRVLLARVRESAIEVRPHTSVHAIAPDPDRVRVTARGPDGAPLTLDARAVVCCTGGQSFVEARRRGHRTTNPENHNHLFYDHLVALGISQIHREYYQYQPFGIVNQLSPGLDKCIPESIVNLPVRLCDRRGRELCPIQQDRYSLTQRMFEAAERGDAVTTADGHVGLWLTLSEVDPARVQRAFPRIFRLLEREQRAGQDLLIFPFLHYQLGGFVVDRRCRTRFDRLFLAGEMIGGLHGKNRLMGNGLTDSLVHGRIAGQAAATTAIAADR